MGCGLSALDCPTGYACVGSYCVLEAGLEQGIYSSGASGGEGAASVHPDGLQFDPDGEACYSSSQCPSGYSCIGGHCTKNPSESASGCSGTTVSAGGGACGGSGSSSCSEPGCGSGSIPEGCNDTTPPGGFPDDDGGGRTCNTRCQEYYETHGTVAAGCPPALGECRECVGGNVRDKDNAPCTCAGSDECDEENCEKCDPEEKTCKEDTRGCMETCQVVVDCCGEDKLVNHQIPKGSGNCKQAAQANAAALCECECAPETTEIETDGDDAPSECSSGKVECSKGGTKTDKDGNKKTTWNKKDYSNLGDGCCGDCNCHNDCKGRKGPNGENYNACGHDLMCYEEEIVCSNKTYCTDTGTGVASCPAGSTLTGTIEAGGEKCVLCEVCGESQDVSVPPADPNPCNPPRIDRGGECACPSTRGPNHPGNGGDDVLDITVFTWDGSSCVPSCPTCSPQYPFSG